MKKIICILCAVLCALPLISCGKLSLDEDEALTIINDLLPKADEINVIFFGDGLTAVDDGYLEVHTSTSYFEVKDKSVYSSTDDIKRAAEKVYSDKYLSSVYVAIFEGTHSEGEDEAVDTISARYKDLNGVLKVDVSHSALNIQHLRSVKSLKQTKATKDYIEYEAVCLNTEGEEVSATILLTSQNGNWRLDSPTY